MSVLEPLEQTEIDCYREVREYEVYLKFLNDQDGLDFREWFFCWGGFEAFAEWADQQRGLTDELA